MKIYKCVKMWKREGVEVYGGVDVGAKAGWSVPVKSVSEREGRWRKE